MQSKVIVVTGATGGIGRRVCALLGREGASIVAAGRDPVQLSRLRDELHDQKGQNLYLSADLRTYQGWSHVAASAIRRYGRIDVLVHCVGALMPGAFDSLTPEDVEAVVDTNFLSILNGTLRILPFMKARRSGHLIAVASLGGIVPMPFESLYCATKFAVRGFFLSLREELRHSGVAVSLVSPGPVDTAMLSSEAQDDKSTISFVERPLTPDQVASSIIKVIRKKQAESVVPARSRIAAILMGAFPALFTALYPLLDRIGGIRLKNFRNRAPQSTRVQFREPRYE